MDSFQTMRAIRTFCAVLGVALLLTACGASASASSPTAPADNMTVIDPPLVLTDFALANSAGMTTTLADWQQKLTLVTFGYTHCPDVCPITLAHFKQVHLALKAYDGQVNYVFVSVDGARDTPAVLAAHLQLFDSAIIGLTGSDAAVQVLSKQFGIYYQLEKTSPNQTDYTITHTASSFLVDRQGRLIRIYNYNFDPQVISADIRQQLTAS